MESWLWAVVLKPFVLLLYVGFLRFLKLVLPPKWQDILLRDLGQPRTHK